MVHAAKRWVAVLALLGAASGCAAEASEPGEAVGQEAEQLRFENTTWIGPGTGTWWETTWLDISFYQDVEIVGYQTEVVHKFALHFWDPYDTNSVLCKATSVTAGGPHETLCGGIIP